VSSGPLVSVLVTGYRRPAHLRRTIESFLRVNTYPNLELILADDGSAPALQAEMRQLPFDRFLLPEVNRGLGANTNAGLRAARGDFILHLQDDWLCEGPGGFVEAALDVMAERPEIGLVRLCSRDPELSYSNWTSRGGLSVRIYASPPASRSHFVYTDNPHIKSRALVDFMGPYLESRYMQKTELDMRDRFNAQTRFAAAFIEGFHCFEHIGEDMSFNRPTPRAWLSAQLGKIPLLGSAVRGYRRWKQGSGP
jgi:glycosyltransferase involved in cell wall biosynthesis